MFTAVEFKLIREKCPEKLDALLANLKIEKPNWNVGDEFRIYEKLDDEIVSKVCQLLKSNAVIVGYEKLLAMGDLKFDYSKTDNEILNEVLHFEKQIKNRLQEKLVEYEKISTLPPEVETVEFDYSNVKIEFSRADFEIGIPSHNKKLVLSNREKLTLPQDLATQIKNLICDYLRIKENYNVVKAVEVSVKTKNGTYPEKSSPRQKNTARPEPPPFTQDELSEVVKSLRLVEDIIKSI